MNTKKGRTTTIAVIGGVLLMLILMVGTVWMSQSARTGTERAVRTVSLLFLDELAGRREQVVEGNLQNKINVIQVAIELMTAEDLQDQAHLQAYQARMKRLYTLDKFAFVDTEGLIYTSQGIQSNIDEYRFDYRTITKPEISLFEPGDGRRQVIIAVPVQLTFRDKDLCVCFMAIDMSEMLAGVSMDYQSSDATYSNLYTASGEALTNQVLGGQAAGTNLLEALKEARFDGEYSYEQVVADFAAGTARQVSFTYGDVLETLSYVPVKGTDWFLTYLIRESVISRQIDSISDSIIRRSILQSARRYACC